MGIDKVKCISPSTAHPHPSHEESRSESRTSKCRSSCAVEALELFKPHRSNLYTHKCIYWPLQKHSITWHNIRSRCLHRTEVPTVQARASDTLTACTIKLRHGLRLLLEEFVLYQMTGQSPRTFKRFPLPLAKNKYTQSRQTCRHLMGDNPVDVQ